MTDEDGVRLTSKLLLAESGAVALKSELSLAETLHVILVCMPLLTDDVEGLTTRLSLTESDDV